MSANADALCPRRHRTSTQSKRRDCIATPQARKSRPRPSPAQYPNQEELKPVNDKQTKRLTSPNNSPCTLPKFVTRLSNVCNIFSCMSTPWFMHSPIVCTIFGTAERGTAERAMRRCREPRDIPTILEDLVEQPMKTGRRRSSEWGPST